MNIAVCFSGQPRECADIWPTCMKYLLSNLPNPDIFIHSSQPYPQDFLDVLQPKAYVVEGQMMYPEVETLLARVGYAALEHRNSYLQEINGYRQVWKLKKAYEEHHNVHYDLIIRTRPDLIYLRDIKLELFELDKINNFYRNDGYPFYVAEFVLGPNAVMDRFFRIWEWLVKDGEQYLRPDNWRLKHLGHYHPSSIMATYLEDYCGLVFGKPKLPDDIKGKVNRKSVPYCFYRIMYRHRAGCYEVDIPLQIEEDQRMGWDIY